MRFLRESTFLMIMMIEVVLCLFLLGSLSLSADAQDWPEKPHLFDFKASMKQRQKLMKQFSYPYNQNGVDRRSGLTIKEFRDIYDAKWPVLITDVVPTWKSMNWTKDFFLEHFGEERVVMKAVNGELKDASSFALPLKHFISHLGDSSPNMWTYLEDELFIPLHAELRDDVGENKYTDEDYFKMFAPAIQPWDCMLLWGTRYSRSYLHIDPYNWTGTNAVLKGKKLWKLYPPGQDHLFDVFPDRKCGFPLDCIKYNSPVDAFDPDFEKFKNFKKAKAIEFEQNPGELLIIPTGWFHQAYNAEETMAVSGQIMNRNNYLVVLEEIIKGGSLPRWNIPNEIKQLKIDEQVKLFLYLLPKDLLQKGKKVTDSVIEQMKYSKTEL